MSKNGMFIRNRKGDVIFLPLASRFEMQRRYERKRAALKVFATTCLLMAFGVAMALYANVVNGRF